MPAPTLQIALSGSYRIDSRLDKLIESLAPLHALQEPHRLELDLSGLVSIGPTALALLTASLKEANERDLLAAGTLLRHPQSRPVANYLLRMDMLRVLVGEDFYEEGYERFERREPVGFRPCAEFVTPEECIAVARDLAAALTESCEADRVARGAIRICLDELAENVLHHADAPRGGFAAAQGWRKSSTIEIGIVDLGIGIRSSLRKNEQYADIDDDATAIAKALELRVTSTPERNSGIGLYVTKLLLAANGGLLLVRSGSAGVYAGAVDEPFVSQQPFPGTLVALRARTDRPLDINQVYRELDDGDDGDDAD